MSNVNAWQAVIGVETHIQLRTQSKLFSGASTAYGALPNTQVCALDLAMPGTLPVLNKEAVRMAIIFGVSIGAEIAPETVFARKHYFYPDLPKGYQISQHDKPIVGTKGLITIETAENIFKKIHITRAHLEEDAGKLLHEDFQASTSQTKDCSGIDLNRAGVPLLEIVSEPELASAKEVVLYTKALHTLVTYLNICDGNMQEGSFRCDVNVSVRKKDNPTLGTRVEIKNLNSFRFIEKAINFEIARQIQLLESNQPVFLETRLFDPKLNETRSLRAKETAGDYRYFPDPDLCPVHISSEWIESIANELPELPEAKHQRFQTQYGLSAYDSQILVSNRALADYFEAVVSYEIAPKLAVNWINGELAAALNESNREIAESPISAQKLATLLRRVEDNTLSTTIAKTVFVELWEGLELVDTFIQQKNLAQLTNNSDIEHLVDEVLKDNPQQLEQYLQGKVKLFGFFIGQAMQRSQGRCHPEQLNQILQKKLHYMASSH